MDTQHQTDGSQEPRQASRQSLRERSAAVARSFRRQRELVRATIGLASTALLQAAIIVLLFHSSGHGLVLHYTTRFGIDRVGPWWLLLALPGALVAAAALNAAVAVRFGPRLALTNGLVIAVDVVLAVVVSAALALLILANQSLV